MNGSTSNAMAWSRGRWWMAAVITLIVQVLLIVALSDLRPIVPRQSETQTSLRLVGDAPPDSAIGALVNLEDPTLFALPGLRGFSGAAWMKAQPPARRRIDLAEPPRWLTQNVDQLGAAFAELVRTNPAPHHAFGDKPAPRLTEITVPPVPLPVKSSLRIEGDLAGRELMTPLEVPSFPHTDLLTNTVVQISVGPSGFPFPPFVLTGSGSKTADQRGLELARSIRFKPLAATGGRSPRNADSLTWGKIVFQWHTIEPPLTNLPAALASP
jgi:hypothetical protein